MVSYTINSVILQTILLGSLSVYFGKKISKTLISPSTAYWFGWLFLILGASVAINNDWITMRSSQYLYYITQLNYGAFIGFFMGTILSPSPTKNKKKYALLIDQAKQILNKLSKNVLITLFILGLVFLFIRIRMVGLNTNYFENVRGVYAEGKRPFIDWISTHLSMIVILLIILQGVVDAEKEMNIKMLAKVLFASAPLGLANGSRIFLLNYLILYMASLLICRGAFGKYKLLLTKKEWKKSLILFSAILIIFSIIGFARGGYGAKINIFFIILIWPISTIGAMNSWISVALSSHRTAGLFTFGWFIEFFNRIGLVDYTRELKTIHSTINYFISIGNSAAYIPRSIIPDLIFDFGGKGVFWGGLVISFFLQIATLRLAGKGVFSHTLAVLCVVAAFMTIQSSVIGPAVIAVLFWAAVFSFIVKIKKNNLFMSNKS